MSINSDKLKAIYKEFADTYNKACENSRKAYIEKLAPGSTLPKTGKLYSESDRNEFRAYCSNCAGKVAEIIDAEADRINKELVKEPTAEAVNACTLLSLRKSTDRDEYERFLKKYEDTPQVCSTIKSIAKDNGVIGLPNDKYSATADDLIYLKNKLMSKMTVVNAEQGSAEPMSVTTMQMSIDQLMPED